MTQFARLVGLFFFIPLAISTAHAGTDFVVIGSGDPFTFSRKSEFKIDNKSFSTYQRIEGSATGKTYTHHANISSELTSRIGILYNGKTYTLVKNGRKSGFQRTADAEKDSPGLADALTRGEVLALSLMQKNLDVADDTAGVIKDSPYHLVQEKDFPFDNVPAKISFRYALVIETDGTKVVSYKFIRQGSETTP